MRIVQINGGAKGSTGKIMLGIAEVARAQGHEVMCASPITSTNRDAGADCGYYRIGTYQSRRLNVALARISGFNGCFAWIETYKLLKKMDEFKPDIIHLHNLHDSYINLPMLFSYIKKRDIPVVWTLHDCWAFTGQCPHFVMEKCDKWKTGCNHCVKYREYPATLFDNTKQMWKLKKKWFTGPENLTIVTPSFWLRDLVKQSYLKNKEICVIQNGVDLDIFKPRESKRFSKFAGKYVVLGVAFGWGFRKGLDVFNVLAELLPDKYQIVLVGTDEIVEKEIHKDIVCIRRTADQTELAEIYSAADVLINPTREEVLGMVNIEALACGLPVVTFDTGGSPEIVDSNCGIVVPCEDIDALIQAVENVCGAQGVMRNDACRRAKCFDMHNKFLEYIELYESIQGTSSQVSLKSRRG